MESLHPCHIKPVPVKVTKVTVATSVSASTATRFSRPGTFAHTSNSDRLLPVHSLFATWIPNPCSAVVLDAFDKPVRHDARDLLGRAEQCLDLVFQETWGQSVVGVDDYPWSPSE
ncbi:hypothetical protein EMPS_10611 [Entomortierella parvispora]|uniref:Uncharacterized protein n=1 Tax=Entomortierella parvispora TaxID=205924 RepID=A0A9P3HKC2_9FUNG|nr:hypothetical protein EMPS_10611 [Entomortierella parvispora]